jgi:hypothetical protein
MEIKQQAQWLRGFLDSLSNSDNISKRQIEILSVKLNDLISSVEASEFNDYYEEPTPNNTNVQNTNRSNERELTADDLPF